MPLIIDIETAGRQLEPSVAEQIKAEMKPPSHYKNAEVIEKWKNKQMLDKAALDPYLGQVTCIGLLSYYAPGDWGEPMSFVHQDEAEVMRWFYDTTADLIVARNETDGAAVDRGSLDPIYPWLGYNIIGFDLPFLAMATLRTKAQASISTARRVYVHDSRIRYNRQFAVDIMLILQGQSGKRTKDFIASALGLAVPEGPKGEDMPRLFEEGDFESIIKHNLDDLQTTAELIDKVSVLSPAGVYGL